MSTAASALQARRETEVIALVGFGHGVSHFFQLMLPPLFPWLMVEFSLNFTEAGAMMTAFFVVSGAGQAVAGFVVDRVGARRVQSAGVGLLALSGFAAAAAQNYPMLLLAGALAGLGNSVFHPADYTILNRGVSMPRLGHAFSAHGLSGNLGWALGPVFMTGLAAASHWRVAAAAAGLVGLLALGLLHWRRHTLFEPAVEHAPADVGVGWAGRLAFLTAGPVWMCFGFFLVTTLALGALQNFAAPVLREIYGLSLAAAAGGLTAYMLGGAAGIVTGGYLATKKESHDTLIACALSAAAAVALVLASGAVPAEAVTAAMALVGFCTGMAHPSRDLLVRRVATSRFGHHAFGRVYGFVYSGLDAGLASAPVLFGRLMDAGLFWAVLAGVAVLQGLAVLAALQVGSTKPTAPRANPAGR